MPSDLGVLLSLRDDELPVGVGPVGDGEAEGVRRLRLGLQKEGLDHRALDGRRECGQLVHVAGSLPARRSGVGDDAGRRRDGGGIPVVVPASGEYQPDCQHHASEQSPTHRRHLRVVRRPPWFTAPPEANREAVALHSRMGRRRRVVRLGHARAGGRPPSWFGGDKEHVAGVAAFHCAGGTASELDPPSQVERPQDRQVDYPQRPQAASPPRWSRERRRGARRA